MEAGSNQKSTSNRRKSNRKCDVWCKGCISEERWIREQSIDQGEIEGDGRWIKHQSKERWIRELSKERWVMEAGSNQKSTSNR